MSTPEVLEAPEIKLGDQVRDKISGFAGVVTAISTYLNGCNRILVTAEQTNGDGKIVDWWIDDVQLEVRGTKYAASAKATGGDRPAPSFNDPS